LPTPGLTKKNKKKLKRPSSGAIADVARTWSFLVNKIRISRFLIINLKIGLNQKIVHKIYLLKDT
jgi:hypothetical protein